MNDIQKARDVLAKWKQALATFPGPWGVRNEQPGRSNWADVVFDADSNSLFTYDEPGGDEFSPYHDASTDPGVARLIVGTAGNPDLLDAIDVLLSFAQAAVVGPNDGHFGSMVGQAHIIAAAIIAADERVQQ